MGLAPVRRRSALAALVWTLLLLSGCGNGVQITAGPAVTPPATSVPTDSPVPAPTKPTTTKSTKHPKNRPGSTGPTVSSSHPASTRAPSPTSTPTTSTPTTSTPPSRPATSKEPTPTSVKAPRCTLADLRVGSAPPEGGRSAGSSYVLLTFTNHSQARCSLRGFSGVSFVGGGNGTQLGAPARRITGYTERRVELAPGKLVAELVQVIDPDVFASACTKTTADGFRVYPPGSRTAAYVPYPSPACVDRNIEQLQVAPVGSQ